MVRPFSRSVLLLTLVVGFLSTLQACTLFRPGFQKPEVKIDSLQLLPSEGLSQRFRIGLLLSNPNDTALPVAGMTYNVSLNGHRVVSGVTGDVPSLPPYTETKVSVEGSADLVSVLRLLNSLVGQSSDALDYELLATIDLLGLRPTLQVRESGKIELRRPGEQRDQARP
jgi:LEA14-like dessication related protein